MKKFILLLVVASALFVSARFMLSWSRPNSDSSSRVSITITGGSSLGTIASKLEEHELIRDSFAFEWYIRWNKLSSKLQAGEYVIPRNLTFSEIADTLQHGKSEEIRITIPEGSTIAQIDALLAKKSLIEEGEFVACTNFCDLGFRISSLEGSLFPSTYYVNPNTFTSKKFIQRLYNTFRDQLSPLTTKIQESGRTLNEIVIVASMIEREAFGDSYEEKQKIADIIWKRYDEGIHLGIDATTRYELNEWKRPLYTEDFQSDSPYNTRRKLGLPPTAISNPGLDSLRATIDPLETEYYYYLHDRSGQIRFGRTLDDHNANKREYLY